MLNNFKDAKLTLDLKLSMWVGKVIVKWARFPNTPVNLMASVLYWAFKEGKMEAPTLMPCKRHDFTLILMQNFHKLN